MVETIGKIGPAASSDHPRDRHAAPSLSASLMRYHTPTLSRGAFELAVTGGPFVLLWWAMYWSIANGHAWLYCALLPLAVGFLVRLFLIQHDCGHQAFVPSRRANDWIGRCLGVLTLTAYQHWKRAHAIHHATSGNLDRRGVGDIDTLTVAEYAARPRLLRLRYRLYRNPFVMFCIGPAFVFLLQNRIPAGFFRAGWRHWASTFGTDVAIVGAAVAMSRWIGLVPFLKVHAPIMLLSASVGGWLFYVQHQFENTLWSRADRWDFHTAAMQGSSHYHLPPILRWFTANIGVHHVHHVCSRIPFYRLQQALAHVPELQRAERLTLWQSFRCVRLTLWDEASRRLVSFREAEQICLST